MTVKNAYYGARDPELASHGPQPEFFAWPGEFGFETGPKPQKKSPGTDCGRPGRPAALKTAPGGRCIGPVAPVCPPVPGLLSVKDVGNVPFEYVNKVRRDPSTNLVVVAHRLRPRYQTFLPSVQTALQQFVANMKRFGMPIEAILTAGSMCCRCISGYKQAQQSLARRRI